MFKVDNYLKTSLYELTLFNLNKSFHDIMRNIDDVV